MDVTIKRLWSPVCCDNCGTELGKTTGMLPYILCTSCASIEDDLEDTGRDYYRCLAVDEA
jgi:hypothetical protein